MDPNLHLDSQCPGDAFNPNYPGSVVQLVAAIIANLGSVYLACILYFVLQDFCIVCVSIYFVNFVLLLVCIAKVQNTHAELVKKKLR
nr:hypothetical protein BaRGS_003464 [Batillaria attramentaria]